MYALIDKYPNWKSHKLQFIAKPSDEQLCLILPSAFSAKFQYNVSDILREEAENSIMGKIQPTLIIPQQQGAIKPKIMD